MLKPQRTQRSQRKNWLIVAMHVSTRLSQVSTAENLRDRPHERPIFQGFCVSPRRQRSRQHCQQLGDLLRVAGGVGSDATAKAVDGRAEAMQLDVVKNCSSRRQLHIASILSIGQPDVDWRPKRKPDGYFDAKRRGFGKLYPLVAERLKG